MDNGQQIIKYLLNSFLGRTALSPVVLVVITHGN